MNMNRGMDVWIHLQVSVQIHAPPANRSKRRGHMKNFSPPGLELQTLDRPISSELLYRPRYPSHSISYWI
jgi:hypothetical protein